MRRLLAAFAASLPAGATRAPHFDAAGSFEQIDGR